MVLAVAVSPGAAPSDAGGALVAAVHVRRAPRASDTLDARVTAPKAKDSRGSELDLRARRLWFVVWLESKVRQDPQRPADGINGLRPRQSHHCFSDGGWLEATLLILDSVNQSITIIHD